MSTVYLTGTQIPGAALRRFLPDYIEMLTQGGETLLTTNKRGVDELVLHHCEKRQLPLQVCEFTYDKAPQRNRPVIVQSETVQVQRIVSPSWLRFRHMVGKADRIVFLHANRSAGRCNGITTHQAFEQVCRKRNVNGEQLIIQEQEDIWTAVQQLRAAPIVGAAHIYVYARFVPGLDDQRHCVGHFRVETWRQLKGIVQPGVGRQEFVLPNMSREQATLHMLHQALLEMQACPPQRLVIHHRNAWLVKAPYVQGANYPKLRRQVCDLLGQFSQVVWQHDEQSDLLHHIGKSVSQGQELWNHRKPVANYKGLYQ